MADFKTTMEAMLDAYPETKPDMAAAWETLHKDFIAGRELSGAPQDGKVPVWNNGTSKWDWVSPGGSNLFYDTKIYSFRRTNSAACWYSPIGWYATVTRPSVWTGNAGYLIGVPHDGRLVKSIIWTQNDAGTSYIWFYKNFENPSTTQSGNLTPVSLPNSAGYYIQKIWSGKTFAALDHYSLHYNPSNTPGDILMMHVFEYDKTT